MSHDQPQNRSVLVTGANGFVGSTLCPLLDARGFQVRRAVRRRMSDSAHGWVSVGEVGPATDWMPALDGVDVVIHLAARVHVMNDTAADPLAAFRQVNVLGTQALTEQSIQAGVKRLVYVSSIKVNGEETLAGQPFTERLPPDLQSPYAISKWEAEEYLRGQTRIETVIVRPPLVYGPGVGANFLRLLRLVERGLPLPLGWTQNQRSLVAVQNLSDFLLRCLSHSAAAGETFLVSDGQDLSTTALIQSMAKHLGKPARLLPVPAAAVDLPARLLGKREFVKRLWGSLQLDISKAQECLGWTPPLTVDDAIRQTCAWYQEQSGR